LAGGARGLVEVRVVRNWEERNEMTISLILHIVNEDPVVGEVEQLPDPRDQVVVVFNPRRRDGNPVYYLEDDVSTLIVPWHRINFIQVMPEAEMEEVITFVRE
jgi:hypothetical protein